MTLLALRTTPKQCLVGFRQNVTTQFPRRVLLYSYCSGFLSGVRLLLGNPSLLPKRAPKQPLNSASYQLFSNLSQAATVPSVDKNSLSKLRKQTGYAFSNCRKALIINENDFDKALEWLNAEAAKEGWAKATRLQSRAMAQGVIGLIAGSNSALLLEVNCETDFVARNVKFLELVSNITNLCYSRLQADTPTQKLILSSENLGDMVHTANESVADVVAKAVGGIGENLKASRAVYMSTGDNSYLANYIHTAGLNQKYLEIEGCQFGKYSALAVLNGNIHQEEMFLYASQIGQHIVGMNPQTIGEPEPVQELSESEPKPVQKLSEAEDADEPTDDVGGKNMPAVEESRLLYQEFLLDSELTAKQWLDQRELSVTDFARFAVGEALPS